MLFGLSVAACASRSVPSSFPKTSAASAEAQEAPTARVGVALEQDAPPLPGESTEGWRGLEEQPPAKHPDSGSSHGKDGSKGDHAH